MATLHALLVGGGLFALALVVMTERTIQALPRIVFAVLLGVVASGASALYSTSRDSGTGTLVSRGFPRSFHFDWHDHEGRGEERRDINFLFLTANTVVHVGVCALLFAVLPRGRNDNTPTMPAQMLAVRIALGIVFLILAVIGGLVPILQGWIFFLLALLVLFPKAKFTEKILVKAEPKVPRIVAFLRRNGIGRG